MKIFPIVCLVATLLFYLIGYAAVKPAPLPVVNYAGIVPPAKQQEHLEVGHALPASAAAVGTRTAAASTTSTAPPAEVAAAVTSAASSAAPTQSNLRLVLDGSLEAALKLAVLDGKPKFVLVTFGNLGVKDQLANFIKYCSRAGAPHVVGAVDVGAFDLMLS